MKRDPLSITSILIQVLQGLRKEKSYSFNDIRERCNLHWETVKRYLILVKYVQDLAPFIEMNNNKVKIIKKSLEPMDPPDKALLHLFYAKAFNENSAKTFLKKDANMITTLLREELIQKIKGHQFFLTDTGKRKAFKLYRIYTDKIYKEFLSKGR